MSLSGNESQLFIKYIHSILVDGKMIYVISKREHKIGTSCFLEVSDIDMYILARSICYKQLIICVKHS